MINSIHSTLQMHDLVRKPVECLRRTCTNKAINQIFTALFDGNMLYNMLEYHKIDSEYRKLILAVQTNYQKAKAPAKEVHQKAMRDFFQEAIRTETALTVEEMTVKTYGEEDSFKLIIKGGLYTFKDHQQVTALTGLKLAKITVGSDSLLIVEPFAHDLEITLGNNSTITLQYGVYNCMIYLEGKATVNFGPETHDNTVASGSSSLNVHEDPSAKNNTY